MSPAGRWRNHLHDDCNRRLDGAPRRTVAREEHGAPRPHTSTAKVLQQPMVDVGIVEAQPIVGEALYLRAVRRPHAGAAGAALVLRERSRLHGEVQPCAPLIW